MKKIISTTLILVLVASMSLALIPPNVNAANTNTSDNYTAINDASRKITGPVVDTPPDLSAPDPVPYYAVGTVVRWVTANLYTGYYFSAYFKLMATGTNAEIWLACDSAGNPALNWPSGDPRPTPVILSNEISFLLNETDNLIYPTDVQYFGAPAVRDGNLAHYGPAGRFNGSSRLVILVENIIDENYYDPTYPYYVAGYFDTGINYYADRNVITIDSYNWQYRLGPLGTTWTDNINVTRPYVYDSTIAHEFQHLIHADWNPADDTFMNEGCSMYAEFLCGFGIDPSYINSFLYTPDNSLTVWSDQGGINILADYGAAAMWLMYLNDHYGGAPTISYFVQDGIGGIDGVNNALAHFGYKHSTFDTVFHDWRLANLIHTDFPGCTKYNYKSINLNDPIYISAYTHTIGGLPVPQTKGTDFGNTITDLGYDTGVSEIGPYGSDYIKFVNWTGPGFIYFDGNDYADVPGWTMTADGWWSGTGVDLQDASIVGTAKVSTTNPTLTIVTKWGIESYWDFGFVQVSTDSGATWTSLSNSYTTSTHDPSAHPAIVAQLPGLTDYNPDWPGFTTMSFNLTAYAGKTVQIRFRYMTDWATEYEGWWINSATVSGTPMTLATVPYKATFQVTVVQAFVVCKNTIYLPYDLCLTKDTLKGLGIADARKPSYVLLVVSPTMHRGFADYQFFASKVQLFRFCLEE